MTEELTLPGMPDLPPLPFLSRGLSRTDLLEVARSYGLACYRAGMLRATVLCEAERVDAEETGSPEDHAYNRAIEHSVEAIRSELPQGD
jgi:hypothetical protein